MPELVDEIVCDLENLLCLAENFKYSLDSYLEKYENKGSELSPEDQILVIMLSKKISDIISCVNE